MVHPQTFRPTATTSIQVSIIQPQRGPLAPFGVPGGQS